MTTKPVWLMSWVWPRCSASSSVSRRWIFFPTIAAVAAGVYLVVCGPSCSRSREVLLTTASVDRCRRWPRCSRPPGFVVGGHVHPRPYRPSRPVTHGGLPCCGCADHGRTRSPVIDENPASKPTACGRGAGPGPDADTPVCDRSSCHWRFVEFHPAGTLGPEPWRPAVDTTPCRL